MHITSSTPQSSFPLAFADPMTYSHLRISYHTKAVRLHSPPHSAEFGKPVLNIIVQHSNIDTSAT